MKQSEPYLRHILDEIEYLENASKSLKYEDFANNEDLKLAFVRSLEILVRLQNNYPYQLNKNLQTYL